MQDQRTDSADDSGENGEVVTFDLFPRTRLVIEAALLRDLAELLIGAHESVHDLSEKPATFHAYPLGVDAFSHMTWVVETFTALRDLGWTPAAVEAEHDKES